MLYLKAFLGLLLARVNGIELGSDGLRRNGGEGSVNYARGSAKYVEYMGKRIHGVDAMTDEESAVNKGLVMETTCPNERSIAFAITDIEGTNQGEELWMDDDSTGEPQTVTLLKNVRLCEPEGEPYVIKGTKVATAEEFKAEVAAYLAGNGLQAVIYNFHGTYNSPYHSFDLNSYVWKQRYQEATGWLLIPVMWRNPWEYGAAGGLHSMNCPAIRGGKLFAANSDVFKADYPTHVITHSLGNWVYYVMAQKLAELGNSDVLFENHFMVAAAVRADAFADNFNPDAPRTEKEKIRKQHIDISLEDDQPLKHDQGVRLKDIYDSDGFVWKWEYPCSYERATSAVLHEEVATDLSFTECVPYDPINRVPIETCYLNGGYSLTKISNHIHVLWKESDSGLVGDQIGDHGGEAESSMNLQYFKDRVTFHDMTGITRSDHSYQWEYVAASIYDPLLQEDCHETGCDAEVCESPYIEVFSERCWFSTQHREECCRFFH